MLLATIGSAGDVRPFLALGAGLAARGHDVALAANPHFAAEAEAAGLPLFPLGTVEEYEASVRDPDLFDGRRGFEVVARRGILPAIRTVYEWIAGHDPAGTVVVASTLCFGALFARERLGVPTASVHLQPAVLRSLVETPAYPGVRLPRRTPRFLKRLFFRLMDRMVDGVLAPEANAFRAGLGLPPLRRFFGDALHSPDLVLCLFPEWFAPPQPDWPAAALHAGFVRPEPDPTCRLPPEVEAFLAGGDPPVVATAGTAMARADGFFRAAVDGAGRVGRRAVLVTAHPGQLPAALPPGVTTVRWAPFFALFPRAAAVIHHGGIGTTAEALAAGVPQVVMPMSHDQPDNAARLSRLGVGEVVPRRRFRADRVAAALDRLLGSPETARRARDLALRVDFAASLDRALHAIEGLGNPGIAR